MGGAGEPVDELRFLEVSDIVMINHRMIAMFGGLFLAGDDNLANPDSLLYILEVVRTGFFGHNPYPTVFQKAAAVAWCVITRHVFHDGKKRTGLEACRMMLELNGYELRIDGDATEAAVKAAESTITLEEFADWVTTSSSPLE